MESEAEILGIKVFLLNQRAMFATLLENFHLTPSDIAHLTDRQIHSYYLHPRDKHGTIKVPETTLVAAPKTRSLQEEEIALKSLCDSGFIPRQKFDDLLVELREKHGKG